MRRIKFVNMILYLVDNDKSVVCPMTFNGHVEACSIDCAWFSLGEKYQVFVDQKIDNARQTVQDVMCKDHVIGQIVWEKV